MSLFVSMIAPFGGFFASGFKRAFKIKDFGDSIPGHGGVTDRMDCQIMNGVFTWVYYNTFVTRFTVGAIFAEFVLLDRQGQLELFDRMKDFLAAE